MVKPHRKDLEMTRIEEIRRCKYEISFYERQLNDEEFKEQWDESECWLQYWKDRLEKVMKGEQK